MKKISILFSLLFSLQAFAEKGNKNQLITFNDHKKDKAECSIDKENLLSNLSIELKPVGEKFKKKKKGKKNKKPVNQLGRKGNKKESSRKQSCFKW